MLFEMRRAAERIGRALEAASAATADATSEAAAATTAGASVPPSAPPPPPSDEERTPTQVAAEADTISRLHLTDRTDEPRASGA